MSKGNLERAIALLKLKEASCLSVGKVFNKSDRYKGLRTYRLLPSLGSRSTICYAAMTPIA